MTDRVTNLVLAERFAALIALVSTQPTAVLDQREAARAVTDAARAGEARFSLRDGALLVDGAPFDSPFLASRFEAYGVEELAITARAAQADLLDLARMLAAVPTASNPVSAFAARASALDAKALPRRLRAPVVRATPADALPTSAAVPAAPRVSGASRRVTPLGQSAIPPVGARPPRASSPGMPAVSGPATSSSSTDPTEPTDPAVTAPIRRTPVGVAAPFPAAPESVPPAATDPEPRDAPERLEAALAIPETRQQVLAAARDALLRADTPQRLTAALDSLTMLCDLAFRQGRSDDLVESLATLVAVEYELLERDASDERRQALNHSVRKLARPVLLRQLAVLRHVHAGDPVIALRLQQVLYRFGVDGAEAVIDEFAAAPTEQARAACLESLRGLRRTYDALLALSRDPQESIVRQTAQLLGALRDPRADAILVELLQHPDARTRRIAVASLANSARPDALQAVASALDDESSLVRLRAVAALSGRREPEVLRWLMALIDRETDREVLYAAVGAVGGIGTPEAVQALIPIAEGAGENPLSKSTGMRIQACSALAIIRTPTAMAAVQSLRKDRDREVREAAVRLVAQAQRRTTSTGIPVVSGP